MHTIGTGPIPGREGRCVASFPEGRYRARSQLGEPDGIEKTFSIIDGAAGGRREVTDRHGDVALYIGWVDCGLQDLIVALGDYLCLTQCLLTAIDSCEDMKQISSLQDFETIDFLERGTAGSAALLPTAAAIGAMRAGELFDGFDEVWFCGSKPVGVLPEYATILPPAENSARRSSVLLGWCSQLDVRIGLGSGIGTNYATVDYSIHEWVQRWAEQTGLAALNGRFTEGC